MENKIDRAIKALKPCTKALMKLSAQSYFQSEQHHDKNNFIEKTKIFKNEYHR